MTACEELRVLFGRIRQQNEAILGLNTGDGCEDIRYARKSAQFVLALAV